MAHWQLASDALPFSSDFVFMRLIPSAVGCTSAGGCTPGWRVLGVSGLSGTKMAVELWGSPDGRTWTRETSFEFANVGPLEFGIAATLYGGVVVGGAAGSHGSVRAGIYEAHGGVDGLVGSWSPVRAQPAFDTLSLTDVIAVADGFLAVGCHVALSSCDGIASLGGTGSWTRFEGPAQGGTPVGIASGTAGFVAWGPECWELCMPQRSTIWWLRSASPDETWVEVPAQQSLSKGLITDIVPGDTGYLAIGSDTSSQTAMVWSSPDGQTWTTVAPSGTFGGGAPAAVAGLLGRYGTAPYVAVGRSADGGAGAVWRSPDGGTWRLTDEGPELGDTADLRLVAAAGGRPTVVAGYRQGPDGVTVPAIWLGPPLAPI